MLLTLIRKVKANFLRFRFDKIFHPFSSIYLQLAYLSKLSKWRAANKDIPFNDFYLKKFDNNNRYKVYQYLVETEKFEEEIDYLEFGVADGYTMRWWLDNLKSEKTRFFGFDTFTGLPEDWGPFKKGYFSSGGSVPEFNDSRCQLYEGLFQATFPKFLESFKNDRRKIIHLDADLYSSTLFVLTTFGYKIKPNDIIMFDEFNVPMHEFRAYTDFTSSFYMKLKPLAATNNFFHVAMKVIE